MAQSRFFSACDNEINCLMRRASNADTKSTMFGCECLPVGKMKEKRKVETELSNYAPERLNSILCRCFAEICKQDRSEYEPDCLRVTLAAMDRKLSGVKYL